MKDALTILVVSAVTLVWAAVFVASIFTKEYQPLLLVSGPMLAVVGYATGVSLAKRASNDA